MLQREPRELMMMMMMMMIHYIKLYKLHTQHLQHMFLVNRMTKVAQRKAHITNVWPLLYVYKCLPLNCT